MTKRKRNNGPTLAEQARGARRVRVLSTLAIKRLAAGYPPSTLGAVYQDLDAEEIIMELSQRLLDKITDTAQLKYR